MQSTHDSPNFLSVFPRIAPQVPMTRWNCTGTTQITAALAVAIMYKLHYSLLYTLLAVY